jgi:hypothetical protein
VKSILYHLQFKKKHNHNKKRKKKEFTTLIGSEQVPLFWSSLSIA